MKTLTASSHVGFLVLLALIFGSPIICTAQVRTKSIDGVWTQPRGPFGTDTLTIQNGEIDESFVWQSGGTRRRLYGRILECSFDPGRLKFSVFKVTQGDTEVAIQPSVRFMIFEVAERELWTYSDSAQYPSRQRLKVHAYRNTWLNSNFSNYANRFYDSSSATCNDSLIFETYEFQEDVTSIHLATIAPQFPGGEPAMQHYFNNGFSPPENIMGYQGMLQVMATVTCDGGISQTYAPASELNRLFPKTVNLLVDKVRLMPKWTPAYDNYRRVPCTMRIRFLIRDGELTVNYRQ